MEEISKVETLTPYEVGQKLNKNAETIRAGLRQGRFPFRYSHTRKNRSMGLFNNKE